MIDQKDLERIYLHAYVPEHLVDYVASVSGAEPHLFDQFLCYKRDEILIFIGYPLGEAFNEKRMESSLGCAMKHFKPRIISLMAPTISEKQAQIVQQESDSYYRLELDAFTISLDVQTTIRRAAREIAVETGKIWSAENDSIITEFLSTHKIPEEIQRIFARIPEYLSSSHTALLLNARASDGTLIAFDVADYGSRDYSFYIFNFGSRKNYIPGASDFLLSELISIARAKGKRFVNLGLAIHDGIAFFKKKWGGLPFLNHEFVLYKTARTGIIESLLGRL